MIQLKITVAMDADKTSTTPASVRSLSSNERLMNGLKALGITWGIAVLCIFIPVFHFILVPGFLIAGIVMFFIQHRRKELVERAQFSCPECKNEIDIQKLSFNWPLRYTCPKCQMVLLLDTITS